METSNFIHLHLKIEAELRRMIGLVEFQAGALLPTELELASRFGASRGTVRLALNRLVERGLLQRKAGVGTRVAPIASESSVGAWRSFSEEMGRRNIKVECYHLDFRPVVASNKVAMALQIEPGTEIQRLDRIRGWEDQCILHSRSWFHPRVRLKRSTEFVLPLYQVIQEQTGAVATSAREQFAAVKASGDLARSLKVRSGEPLLLRSHTVFDAGKRLIEFAEVHYVSSRFTLTMDLKEGS